jgi:ABC-type branched-subunit amino acid transport system ATPase component
MTVKAAKLLALGIVLWTMGAHATMLVVQKKVSISRALAGHVVVLGTEEPASGVTVELCSSDWRKIIAATKTDRS